ncbi:MAG: hypothetical protein WCV90_07900 [Candidatus Woesearchaeota archaeon]
MRLKQTLCGLVMGLTLLGSGCASEEVKGIGTEVEVPAECQKIYNFGYNPTAGKYFVSCQKTEGGYSFYSRREEDKTWDETKFGVRPRESEILFPAACQQVYNFGYNFAASRYFVSCQKVDQGFSFYTIRPKDNGSIPWKEVKFKTPNGKILEGW